MTNSNSLTKKEIKNAPKYIVRIDLKSIMDYNYAVLEAEDLLGAMLEAEEKYHNDDVYLLDIFEKTDVLGDDNLTIVYKGTIRSRSKGNWHACDKDHYEGECAIQFAARTYNDWEDHINWCCWYADVEMIYA